MTTFFQRKTNKERGKKNPFTFSHRKYGKEPEVRHTQKSCKNETGSNKKKQIKSKHYGQKWNKLCPDNLMQSNSMNRTSY